MKSGSSDTTDQTIVITNKKVVELPTLEVPLIVQKVLQGGTLKGGEFVFQLKDRQGKVIAEATNAADGSVHFPPRTFSEEVSNWIYTIHEVASQDANIVYDHTIYTMNITTKASEGELQATVNVEKNGVPYAGTITFTNSQKLPATGDSTYKVIGVLLGVMLLMIGYYAFMRRREVQR